MFLEKEEFEKLDLETQKKFIESEKEIKKMAKKRKIYKKIGDFLEKFNKFYSKAVFRFGIIVIISSALNLFGIFNTENINKVINKIGAENLTSSFYMFFLGLLIVVLSVKSSRLEASGEVAISEFFVMLLKSFLSLLPIGFLTIYLKIVVANDVSESVLQIIKKYQLIIFLLATISATYYVSKVVDWVEEFLKQAYSNFLENVSDSKDRLTIVVAFLGAIISLIALFK